MHDPQTPADGDATRIGGSSYGNSRRGGASDGAGPSNAVQLGVDPPRASRLVLRATEAGWITRRTDPSDARRTLLALTDEGREEVDRAHRFRQEVFARATADWTDTDRTEFARLISAFVISFAQVAPDAA